MKGKSDKSWLLLKKATPDEDQRIYCLKFDRQMKISIKICETRDKYVFILNSFCEIISKPEN